MSSGQKNIKYNTRERVISPDQNREQAFSAAAVAEALRALVDTRSSTDDVDAGAVASEFASLDNPVVAEVFQGLMVQPQSGSTSVLVSSGTAFFIAPDGGADDSNYKYVSDPGVQSLGALVIAANGGGSPRIDVIECQWSNATQETDSRDIYDPTTDSFSAQTVVKVTAGELTYRVRQGTIGGGFASVGTASGWLPLAIASVPAGSTNNDTVTFWDVRPLLNDRSFGISKMSRDFPRMLKQYGAITFTSGQPRFSGDFETEIAGRRVGGRVRPGVPATDATYIDLSSAINQATGSVPGNNDIAYVYVCVPFGLPRWARYTDGPAGRVPRSPRGIFLVSSIEPTRDGKASATLSLPAGCGLGGSVAITEAQCVAATWTDGSATIAGLSVDGVVQYPQVQFGSIAGSALAGGTATFSLVDGSRYPVNAKAIWVDIEVVGETVNTAVNAQATSASLALKNSAGDTVATIKGPGKFWLPNATGGTDNPTWSFVARIPIIPEYPSVAAATHSVVLTWGTVGMSGSPSSATMRVTGWEFGP